MLPAYKHFCRTQCVAGKNDDRLIDQGELACVDRVAQVLFQRSARQQRGFHCGPENTPGPAALAFCLEQRHLCALCQLCERHDCGRLRDADADADGHSSVIDLERIIEDRDDLLGQPRALARVPGARLENRELVAADTRGECAIAQAGGKTLRDAFKQQISERVAKRIVDDLEVVEIDVQQVDHASAIALPE